MRPHTQSLLLAMIAPVLLCAQPGYRPAIPKTWDEEKLATWAMPLAGLNARPAHIPERQYYGLRIENLRTYPVYFPGREPAGYWEKLQRIGPKPLIEPEKLKTDRDWVEAGQVVFDEADAQHLRNSRT